MTYNKKQMQPLIDKYFINPTTNKLFIKICEMFDGQANYQTWGVKMVFSLALPFTDLEKIHTWIKENANSISKLEKKNIVAYSNKTNAAILLKEIEGINKLNVIKEAISHFNTDQRKMLTKELLDKEITPLKAYSNSEIKKWCEIFKSFNKKPMHRRNKFYSTCSAIKEIEALKIAITNVLKESYSWDKDDLLSYMEDNTKDCNIIFNKDNYVIVEVPSFQSSQKLCGNGRTGWCLSREASFFRSYVTSYAARKQYFLFDFNRKEADAFAHVGFTVDFTCGRVVEAQTSHNKGMMDKFTQGKESISIHDIFHNLGIDMGLFMQIKDLGFEWNLSNVVQMAKDNPQHFSIAYEKDGIILIRILTTDGFKKLTNKTFIRVDSFTNSFSNYNGGKQSTYILMDFNRPLSDKMAMIAIETYDDAYGQTLFNYAANIFNTSMDENAFKTFLKDVKIDFNDLFKQKEINPSVLLHKYIDNYEELEAIKLIEKEKGNIDVNFEFRGRIPVFSALSHRMYQLFETIVQQKGFNSKIENGFGETLLDSLLYIYGNEGEHLCKEEKEKMEKMICAMLNSPFYNFNEKDENNDVAINVACEHKNEVWVVEGLASNMFVDVNVVNDFGFTALSNCLRAQNLDALKIIGMRRDLVVRDEDVELSRKMQINLDEYIKPNDNVFKRERLLEVVTANASANNEQSN
jgi:hypothetical protein